MKRTGGTAVSVDIYTAVTDCRDRISRAKNRTLCIRRSKKLAGACASACARRCLTHEPAYLSQPGMRRHNDSFHDVHRCNGSDSAKGPAYIPDIGLPSLPLYLLELMFYLATDCNLATCTTTGQLDFLPTTVSREYSSLKVFSEVGGNLPDDVLLWGYFGRRKWLLRIDFVYIYIVVLFFRIIS